MTTTNKGLAALTPESIEYVRLASIKGRVNLESKGMKSRTGPIRPRIAAELGLTPRQPYEAFIVAIQAKMDAIVAAQKETA